MSMLARLSIACLAIAALSACGSQPPSAPPPVSATTAGDRLATAAVVQWPPGLVVIGEGSPQPGDPCCRLGESAATVDYLDDSADLIGCPGSATDPAAAAVVAGSGGRIVGSVNNGSAVITLISVPRGDANAGIAVEGVAGQTDRGAQ